MILLDDYTVEKDKNTYKVLFDKQATSTKNLSTIARKLSSLDLENYIKPKNLVVDDFDVLDSYEIDKLGKSKKTKFTKLDRDDLISSLRAIRRDITKMSKVGLLISNLDIKNIKVLENKILLVGVTNLQTNMEYGYNLLSNNVTMNEFFGSDGIVKETGEGSTMKIYKNIYSKFLESENEFIEDYYDKELKEKETIRSYIKRL